MSFQIIHALYADIIHALHDPSIKNPLLPQKLNKCTLNFRMLCISQVNVYINDLDLTNVVTCKHVLSSSVKKTHLINIYQTAAVNVVLPETTT